MSDPYQIGKDVEWLKHSNDELSRLVKKRQKQLARARFFALLLVLALGWVLYKFLQKHPLEELWRVQPRHFISSWPGRQRPVAQS